LSEEIPRLQTVTRPVEDVDAEVVMCLERLLSLAKAGGIQGVVFATVESDGAGSVVATGSGYAGEGARQNVHAMLGVIIVAQQRFMAERLP
jgi:hypothetical protein